MSGNRGADLCRDACPATMDGGRQPVAIELNPISQECNVSKGAGAGGIVTL
jgi:hypothetical protein